MAFLGKNLKLGGKVMVPYIARLLAITINNNVIPDDWKQKL
jgi:hypothetical protein